MGIVPKMNSLAPADAMPPSVKIFFRMCVLLAAWWVFILVKFIAFPSADYLAMIAKLHAYVPDIRQRDIALTAGRTFLWSSILLLLAWLIAYRRRNWARWTLVSVFVFVEIVPIIALHQDAATAGLGTFWRTYIHYYWSAPSAYALLAYKAALIVLVFSGNARPWFRPAAPTA